MAIIQSGADGSVLAVNASKAARILPYDSTGTSLYPNYYVSATAQIQVRQTTTTASDQTVFLLLNNTRGRTLLVTNTFLSLTFDGSPVATIMKYYWIRYSSVTSLTNGTTVVPIYKHGYLPASSSSSVIAQYSGVTATVKVLDTGMSFVPVTSYVVAGDMIGGRNQINSSANATQLWNTQYDFDFSTTHNGALKLDYQEALALLLHATAVVGDKADGYVQWFEY